jgi:TonB family protein
MLISSQLTKVIQRHTIFLSLLLHLLFFVNYLFLLFYSPAPQEQPPAAPYVPAYAYDETAYAPPPPRPAAPPQKSVPASPLGIEKPAPARTMAQQKPLSSAAKAQAAPRAMAVSKDNQEVHLIGDKGTPKPLIKLLAKALAAHLIYPRVAIDFNLRGLVVIKFVLHPNGEVSNVRVIQSSSTNVLDQAAFNAVQGMSPVTNVNPYLSEAKELEVGVIFR